MLFGSRSSAFRHPHTSSGSLFWNLFLPEGGQVSEISVFQLWSQKAPLGPSDALAIYFKQETQSESFSQPLQNTVEAWSHYLSWRFFVLERKTS